jgi:hypothetical protein
MAKLKLQLAQSQRADLQRVLAVDVTRLRQAAERLQGSPHLLRPAELRDRLTEFVGGDAARALTRLLLALLTFRRSRRGAVAELQAAVHEAVQEDEVLSSETRQAWIAARPTFDMLLGAEGSHSVAKSLQLSLDHANLLDDLRIICDIRPVFDDRQSEVVGGIISHILRVEYFSDDGPHTLSLAMSDDDLNRLADTCRTAKLKAEKLREGLTKGLKIRAFIGGEENYED